jgi:arylsulfatase A-like enzyme
MERGGVAPARRARVDDALVRTIDLAPTIAAALGVPGALPESPEARDLASLGPGEDLVVFGEASMPWNVELPGEYPNRHKQRAIRSRTGTLVATPWSRRIEWFARSADPGELEAREVPPGEESQRLMRLLEEWGARGVPRDPPTGIDPELVEQLHGLGYVDR